MEEGCEMPGIGEGQSALKGTFKLSESERGCSDALGIHAAPPYFELKSN